MADAQMQSTRVFKFAEYATDAVPIPDAVLPAEELVLSSVRVGALGDSITEQNTFTSALAYRAAGYMSWLMVLSKQRVHFDITLNFGVGGNTTAQMLDRTDAAIKVMQSKGGKLMVVLGGTNDISFGYTAETIIDNLAKIYDKLLAAGITPIAVPILPRYASGGGGAIDTATQGVLQRANHLIRTHVRNNPNIRMVDVTLGLTDQANNLGYPIGVAGGILGVTYDGLHLTARGGFILGEGLSNAVSPSFIIPPSAAISQADLFDAVNNPSGNMFVNGFMLGTGGTLGTGATGQVANNLTVARVAGTTGSVACSKTTLLCDDVEISAQQLVCTANAGSASETFRVDLARYNNVAIGDRMYAELEYEITGIGADSLKGFDLKIINSAQATANALSQDTGYFPNKSHRGVLRTPIITCTTANTIQSTFNVTLDGTVAGAAASVKFTRWGVKKVVPR